MASFELLDRAADGFQTRLRLVTDAQRTLPTPCPEFNVHDLVAHQVRGMRIYTLLLHGAAREVVAKEQDSDIGSDDWVGAFRGAYQVMREGFGAPGALERTVAHPGMGEIPATMLFDLRLGELAVHGWDLARAIGADDTIDPDVVAALWAFAEPLSGMLPSTGYFSSPSGDVPDTAPMQTRLLDLLGRRPLRGISEPVSASLDAATRRAYLPIRTLRGQHQAPSSRVRIRRSALGLTLQGSRDSTRTEG